MNTPASTTALKAFMEEEKKPVRRVSNDAGTVATMDSIEKSKQDKNGTSRRGGKRSTKSTKPLLDDFMEEMNNSFSSAVDLECQTVDSRDLAVVASPSGKTSKGTRRGGRRNQVDDV